MFRFTIKSISLFISALFLIIYAQSSSAATLPIRLAWDRNTEFDLAYYRVYYGTSSRKYSYYVPIDKQYPSCSLDENYLTVGRTYYIALTALDFSLNESGYSDELVVYIESSPTNTTTTSPNITTTTTATPTNQREYCSTDPTLTLHGTIPEEGTMSVTIPDDLTDVTSASLFLTLWDPDVSGEGYIYINDNDPIDLPAGNYDDSVHSFEVPINLNWLVQGENSFRFTHVATYGYEVRELCIRVVYQNITTTVPPLPTSTTTTIPSDQNEYCTTDPVLMLHGGIPEEGTISVTLPDDLGNAILASLFLTLWDPDVSGEGYIYINDNDPIDLPAGNYDNSVHSFEVPINLNWLVQGENSFRFTHVATYGYEVRELCVRVAYQGTATTSLSPPIPVTTSIRVYPTTVPATTTSITPDDTPPTGTVVINNGDDITYSQPVTLHLSAEDSESGMGEGAEMMFSNDNTQWSSPESFAQNKDWLLSAGEGEKTVYAKFCNSVGTWMTQPVSDSIILEASAACLKPIQLDTTAIGSSGDSIPFWPKENAVDGKTDTGWLSTLRFLFMQEEYLTIDLGETKIVNRIDTCSNPFLFFDLFPSDFKIQVSTDNEEWVEVFSEKDYSSPSSHTDSWVFEETEARYIKMVITKAKSFLLLFYLTYIAEINVHGCEKTDTLSSMTLFDGTKARVVKLTPATEPPDKTKPSPSNVPPGIPGKPVFILNNHP